MPRRDVEGFIRIKVLMQTRKLDKNLEVKDSQIDQFTSVTKKSLADNPQYHLYLLSPISAELYAGVAQEWNNLSADDKELTLAFLEKPGKRNLSVELFQKFLDLKASASIQTKAAAEFGKIDA
ncbi:MAG: hypothetical protein P8Y67_14265 [Alphaproteobacteria bacterium]